MIITIPQVKEQFDKWNGIIFDGELPTPTFELMHTKSILGQFCPRKVLGQNVYKIRISTFYDRPFEFYVDTIVHEMLHYWIKYKGIKDTSSHGREWKKYAAQISNKYGLTITRTNPAGGGVSQMVLDKKNERRVKMEYVYVCEMRNGRYGAGVVPPTKVSQFKPRFDNWRSVVHYKIVKAPWAETYKLRHLRTVCGVGYITKAQYDKLSAYKAL